MVKMSLIYCIPNHTHKLSVGQRLYSLKIEKKGNFGKYIVLEQADFFPTKTIFCAN